MRRLLIPIFFAVGLAVVFSGGVHAGVDSGVEAEDRVSVKLEGSDNIAVDSRAEYSNYSGYEFEQELILFDNSDQKIFDAYNTVDNTFMKIFLEDGTLKLWSFQKTSMAPSATILTTDNYPLNENFELVVGYDPVADVVYLDINGDRQDSSSTSYGIYYDVWVGTWMIENGYLFNSMFWGLDDAGNENKLCEYPIAQGSGDSIPVILHETPGADSGKINGGGWMDFRDVEGFYNSEILIAEPAETTHSATAGDDNVLIEGEVYDWGYNDNASISILLEYPDGSTEMFDVGVVKRGSPSWSKHITGLSPSTTYDYRVYIGGNLTGRLKTDSGTFTTTDYIWRDIEDQSSNILLYENLILENLRISDDQILPSSSITAYLDLSNPSSTISSSRSWTIIITSENTGETVLEEDYSETLDPGESIVWSQAYEISEEGDYRIEVVGTTENATFSVDKEIFNIEDLPDRLANRLSISETQAQMLLSTIVLCLVVMGTVAVIGSTGANIGNISLVIAVVSFSAMGVLISLGWLPLWIPVLIAFVLLLVLGKKGRSIFGNAGD